ncbi:MAG: GNAT family N-acetyltransferase [Clostridia bacterium]|nr:GNAT family N-acetyltransferase [Clostridia bacterium]
MSIETRPARREDLARVNELRRMVNDVHVNGRPDIFKPGFGQALSDHLYEAFDSDQSDVIVASLDGTIAGFATVQYIRKPETPYTLPRDFYRVEEFGVDAAFRRRGVATALVDYIRRDARAKGFPRVELDAWGFNEGAIAFYKGAGFNPFRVYFEMDTED